MAAPQPTWGELYEVPETTSADDLLRLPDDGSTNELYEGALVRHMTSPAHGAICQRLGFELELCARTNSLPITVVQNSLFDLTPAGATRRTILAPDVAILPSGFTLPWTVPQITPLLVVEVVSESQTLAELALKAQFYRNAGVAEVWVIASHLRVIEVWSTQGRITLNDTQTLTSPLLPGFGVAVRYLLDG